MVIKYIQYPKIHTGSYDTVNDTLNDTVLHKCDNMVKNIPFTRHNIGGQKSSPISGQKIHSLVKKCLVQETILLKIVSFRKHLFFL